MKAEGPREPSRLMVLLVLFLVRGPFGLRMLWRSERFERGEKKLLTVMVVLYTLTVIMAFVIAGKVILERLAGGGMMPPTVH